MKLAILATLYEEHPESKESIIKDYNRLYSQSFDEMIGNVESERLPSLSLCDLDVFAQLDYTKTVSLAALVSHLPFEVVEQQLGFDVLLWAHLGRHSGSRNFKLLKFIGQTYDVPQLTQASRAIKDLCKKSSAELSKLMYGTIEDCHSLAVSFGDLRQYGKPGIEISEKRAADYSFESLATVDRSTTGYAKGWREEKMFGNTFYGLYLDTPACVTLLYKGRPQAQLGMLVSDNETLLINQIQGVTGYIVDADQEVVIEEGKPKRHKSRGLCPLDWQKYLVGVAGTIARKQNLSRLGIQGKIHNRWTRPHGMASEIHMTYDEAGRMYDDVAARLDFTFDASDSNWYTQLDELN